MARAQADGEFPAAGRSVLRIERKIEIDQHERQGLRSRGLLRLERPGSVAALREVRPGRVARVHIEFHPVSGKIGRDADEQVAAGIVRDLLAVPVEPEGRSARGAVEGEVTLGIHEGGQPQRDQVPVAIRRKSHRIEDERRLDHPGAERLLQPDIGRDLTRNVPLHGAREIHGKRSELRKDLLLPEGVVGEHVIGALGWGGIREGERAHVAGPEIVPRLQQGRRGRGGAKRR